MKQIEKMKEIYVKHKAKSKKQKAKSKKQKAKEVNCLTVLEEKFAYGRETGNNSSKKKKDSWLVRVRKRKKRKKFRVKSWTYILY